MHAALRYLLIGSTLALACSGASACLTTTSTDSGSIAPTQITLRPEAFAGNLPCSKLPGSWKTWVATLTDVTDRDHPFTLGSSYPTSCSMPVSFAFVIEGHRYHARVDAYDRDDIVPYGPPGSGSPHMIDPATGMDVSPRWTASCPAEGAPTDPQQEADAGSGGFDTNGAVAVANMNVTFPACSQLEEKLPGSPASIVVDLSTIRTTQTCGDGEGQIDRYVVTPLAPLPPQTVECDATATFEPVTDNGTYRFHVDAFEPGVTSPRWGTNCLAVAKSGLAIPAACDALTDTGSMRIDIVGLLKAAGRSCGADDVAKYSATLVGASIPAATNACSQDVTFRSLAAGNWQAVVDGLSASCDTVFTAFCEAAVSPADTSTATCSLR